ncbi:hypothetical protein LAZ67_9001168 [Cordylochernes scorpioides]|uniref:Reverse transcriptase domain-containing protein n=1 Tax=Cordylochernes scorpioides TaxID=51811 RepID=A0ABY6KUU0_9ARAC|nr:hypothetical protein LAZ67_9001168 [Cordylochernes scorpioides]
MTVPHEDEKFSEVKILNQFVQSLTPLQNSTMVSYDVNSMYLSLPHQLIITQLTRFRQDIQLDPKTVSSIVALSSICLDITEFTFNNQFFKQIRGSPMGSPLSSPLAEKVMSTLDNWIQQQFTPGIHIWRRYIDDILCIYETGHELSILSVLNSFHPDVSFSHESEVNSVLPFLDILIIRTPSHYHTTVYHKINNPTFYTNYNSSCPLSHKINTVRTLTKRLVTHCSLPIFRSIEFSNIKKQLALSQYPHHFIHKYQYNPANLKPLIPHRNTCILPYSPQSATITRMLKSHGINTYFKNNKSLATILRHPITRIQRPTSVRSSGGSVYSVSCNDCSATYVGETDQNKRFCSITLDEHHSERVKVDLYISGQRRNWGSHAYHAAVALGFLHGNYDFCKDYGKLTGWDIFMAAREAVARNLLSDLYSRPLIGRNTAASWRYRNAIAIETPLQSETRRALRRLRYSEARVAAAKTMQVPVQRIQLWTHKPFSGLQYNTHIDYKADSSVDIGQMSRVCQFCSALRFRDEPFGLCCKQVNVCARNETNFLAWHINGLLATCQDPRNFDHSIDVIAMLQDKTEFRNPFLLAISQLAVCNGGGDILSKNLQKLFDILEQQDDPGPWHRNTEHFSL